MPADKPKQFTRCKYKLRGKPFVVTSDYEVKYEVGFGAFGAVCAGIHVETGYQVAIKQVSLASGKSTVPQMQALRVYRELKMLKHFGKIEAPNTIRLFDVIFIPPKERKSFEHVSLVMEYMDTDLDSVIRSKQQLNPLHVQHFVYQTLRGVQCIHRAGVIHRDLKPKNILTNTTCLVKICDFGLSREGTGGAKSVYVETRWYRAPELIMGHTSYDKMVDIWSIGCIFAELLRRKPLWPGHHMKQQMDFILDTLGIPSTDVVEELGTKMAQEYVQTHPHAKPQTPLKSMLPDGIDDLALDLLTNMLAFSPKKRFTVKQCLDHPYFETYPHKDAVDPDDMDQQTKPGDMDKDGDLSPNVQPEMEDEESHFSTGISYDDPKQLEQLTTMDDLRELIYQEMLEFHEDLQAPAEGDMADAAQTKEVGTAKDVQLGAPSKDT